MSFPEGVRWLQEDGRSRLARRAHLQEGRLVVLSCRALIYLCGLCSSHCKPSKWRRACYLLARFVLLCWKTCPSFATGWCCNSPCQATLCTLLKAGLFKWSMRHQDGTRPAEAARELTEEDRRFLELAMEEYAQARPAPVRCHSQAEPTPPCQSCLSPRCCVRTGHCCVREHTWARAGASEAHAKHPGAAARGSRRGGSTCTAGSPAGGADGDS